MWATSVHCSKHLSFQLMLLISFYLFYLHIYVYIYFFNCITILIWNKTQPINTNYHLDIGTFNYATSCPLIMPCPSTMWHCVHQPCHVVSINDIGKVVIYKYAIFKAFKLSINIICEFLFILFTYLLVHIFLIIHVTILTL